MPNFTIDPASLGPLAWETATTLPEGAEVISYNPGAGPVYEDALRQAFNFLRRHDDGRYSSRMKMRVLAAAETAESAREMGARDPNLPGIIGLRIPFAFDDLTEVKRGGLLGVAVVWPGDNGRLVLAVHQGHRRNRIGRLLVHLLNHPVGVVGMTSWVNRHNTIGQHFLLASGFVPTGFNRQGGICWSLGSEEGDDGVEDYIDPLDFVRPRRQRAVAIEDLVAAPTPAPLFDHENAGFGECLEGYPEDD